MASLDDKTLEKKRRAEQFVAKRSLTKDFVEGLLG